MVIKISMRRSNYVNFMNSDIAALSKSQNYIQFSFLNELLLMRSLNFLICSKVTVIGLQHYDFVSNTNILKSFFNSSMLSL